MKLIELSLKLRTLVEDKFVLFTWIELYQSEKSETHLVTPWRITAVDPTLEAMIGSTQKGDTVDLKSKERIKLVTWWKLQWLWPNEKEKMRIDIW